MKPPPVTPAAFRTEHLRVWCVRGVSSPKQQHGPRLMFIACLDTETDDWPGIVATCMVFPAFGHWVDWLEVVESERRRGIATELLAGIQQHLGVTLTAEGLSRKGTEVAWSDVLEISVEPYPFVNESHVHAVALRPAGNLGPGLLDPLPHCCASVHSRAPCTGRA